MVLTGKGEGSVNRKRTIAFFKPLIRAFLSVNLFLHRGLVCAPYAHNLGDLILFIWSRVAPCFTFGIWNWYAILIPRFLTVPAQ